MSINKLIIDTLKPIGIPIQCQVYKGNKVPYITFFEYLQQGEVYLDDEEKATGHYIQINIYSKGKYDDITKQVKELLKNKNFIRKYETELYEEETQLFHRVIRFFFIENI